MNSNVNRLLPDEGAGVWVHFSHGSFTINDSAVPFALFKTGPGHANQGFARTESQVMFSTMLEYGRVLLNVYLGPYMPSETYDCVIEVPLRVDSGQVVMSGGPSDLPEGRTVKLPPGDYRLTCAQRVLGGEDDPNPDTRNRIVMLSGRQHHENNGRIVNIREPVVIKFERPSTGFEVGTLH